MELLASKALERLKFVRSGVPRAGQEHLKRILIQQAQGKIVARSFNYHAHSAALIGETDSEERFSISIDPNRLLSTLQMLGEETVSISLDGGRHTVRVESATGIFEELGGEGHSFPALPSTDGLVKVENPVSLAAALRRGGAAAKANASLEFERVIYLEHNDGIDVVSTNSASIVVAGAEIEATTLPSGSTIDIEIAERLSEMLALPEPTIRVAADFIAMKAGDYFLFAPSTNVRFPDYKRILVHSEDCMEAIVRKDELAKAIKLASQYGSQYGEVFLSFGDFTVIVSSKDSAKGKGSVKIGFTGDCVDTRVKVTGANILRVLSAIEAEEVTILIPMSDTPRQMAIEAASNNERLHATFALLVQQGGDA
jgi:DNA polymerase III sliding clamp (beta) subunit (PCNA family)